MNLARTTAKRLAVSAAIFGIIVSACSGSSATPAPTTAPTDATTPAATTAASVALATPSTTPAPCGTVKIADNAWAGYEADVAVIAYILKNSLHCDVKITNLTEQVSWQGFPTGDVDVILENWGHQDLADLYINQQGAAVDLGSQGNVGIIGWYLPKYYADAHPDLMAAGKDAATFTAALNKVAGDFVTSESGGKGQLLDGDSSYVTNDEALVTGLGLNFKVVYSGSEAASDKAIQAAITATKPILAYYWEPNWFSSVINNQMVHLSLPAYTTGCDSNAKSMTCDYPPYNLNKVVSTTFSKSGSPAFTLIKNFKWTNDAQNAVATDIAKNGMTDDAAAKKWLDANPTVWQAWLP